MLEVAENVFLLARLSFRKKIAAVNRDSPQEHHRNNLSRNKNAPRIEEDKIPQVSEDSQEKIAEKIFHIFFKSGSRILGALSNLFEFF